MNTKTRQSIAIRRAYCKEIEQVENYQEALAADFNGWDLHHKLEIDLCKSKKELLEEDLYYDRPAEELIFLPRAEHKKLHATIKTNRKSFKRLTAEQLEEMKKLREEGKTYKELSEIFNITIPSICKHFNDDYRNRCLASDKEFRENNREYFSNKAKERKEAQKLCNNLKAIVVTAVTGDMYEYNN